MTQTNKMVVKTSEMMTLRSMGMNGREIVEYFAKINNYKGDLKIIAIAVLKAKRIAKQERKHVIYYF